MYSLAEKIWSVYSYIRWETTETRFETGVDMRIQERRSSSRMG